MEKIEVETKAALKPYVALTAENCGRALSIRVNVISLLKISIVYVKFQARDSVFFVPIVTRRMPITEPVPTINGTEILPMSHRYYNEMVCDWKGASRAQGHNGEIVEWYRANGDKMQLHTDTKHIIERYVIELEDILADIC